MDIQPIGSTDKSIISRVFNPIDEAALILNAYSAVEQQPVERLVDLKPFKGCGVYVLYYTGANLRYTSIAEANRKECNTPIYIGKACGGHSRKGITKAVGGSALHSRLKQHARSITEVSSLDINDFHYRYIVTGSAIGVLAEWALLEKYKPVWNAELDGFGNHFVGTTRITQKLSAWDTQHPGRIWGRNKDVTI